jgi:hypothetical protein
MLCIELKRSPVTRISAFYRYKGIAAWFQNRYTINERCYMIHTIQRRAEEDKIGVFCSSNHICPILFYLFQPSKCVNHVKNSKNFVTHFWLLITNFTPEDFIIQKIFKRKAVRQLIINSFIEWNNIW